MEPRTPRKRRALIIMSVMALVAVMLLPTAAFGGSVFDDVADDHTHAADIEWLKDTGITKGCNPSQGNTNFCPENAVTRAQMSTFMKRFFDYLGDEFVQKGEADSVDSSMTSDNAGVVHAFSESESPMPDAYTTLEQISITVPAAGYVKLDASFIIENDHVSGTTDLCGVWWDEDQNAFDGFGSPAMRRVAGDSTGEYRAFGYQTWTYEVASAGTHTYYLNGRGYSGDCDLDEVAMTAVYFPETYGGVAVASVADAGGDDNG